MNSFNVLSSSLKVFGSHFLEASAGTGKTFAIEHLFVRFLLEDDPISIEEILVVTFTRAATRDLKKRIRQNIQKVLSLLENEEESTLEYVQKVKERGYEELKRAKRNLQNALIAFDEVSIFTIHSFCFRMLSEYNFEAHSQLLIQEDQEETKEILEKFVWDLLRTKSFAQHFHPCQIYLALRKHKNDFPDLVNKIATLLSQQAQVPQERSYEELIGILKQNLQKIMQGREIDKVKAQQDFEKFISCYKDLTAPYYSKQIKALCSLLQNEATEESIESILLCKDLFFEKIHSENLKKRCQFPTSEALFYPNLWEDVISTLSPIFIELHDPLRNFFRLGNFCLQKWKEHPHNEAIYTSDQLLHKMKQSLNSPTFFQKVSSRYKALIVDEFQDTDPLQWEIFEKIFFQSNSLVKAKVLVGDPKQSIYSFRNADLLTYLKAKSFFLPQEIKVLDVNYRSEPGLVNGFNLLFSSTSHPEWMQISGSEEKILIPEIKSNPNRQDSVFSDQKRSIHFFVAQGKAVTKRKWPSAEIEENYFFPFIAQEIVYLVEQENYEPSQIAILVKDRYQAQQLQAYLELMGIKASLSRGQSLEETSILQLVKIILGLLRDPYDLNLIKQLLLCPFARESEENIRGGFENSLLLSAAEKMENLKEAYFQKGIGYVLGSFLYQLFGKLSVIETLIAAHNDLLYQAYLQVVEYLIQYEAHHTHSVERLLLHLSKLQTLDPDENSIARVKHPEESEKVQIMTTHISKGLEFDIVFALGMAYRFHAENDWVVAQNEVLTKQKDQQRLVAYMEAQKEEKLRQFYVAVTRAKKRVYIPLAIDVEGEITSANAPIELFLKKLSYALYTEERNDAFHGALDYLRQNEAFSISLLKEPLTLVSKPQNRTHVTTLIRPDLIDIKCHAYRTYSFSYLTKKRKEKVSEEKEVLPMDDGISIHTLPKGAFTGEVLHNIFERIFREKVLMYPHSLFLLNIIEQEVRGTILEKWRDPIFNMVSSIISNPFFKARKSFSLSEIAPEKAQVEMEFLFPFQGSFVKGFIDLVFEHEGHFFIVDWKSNWLGNSEEDYSIQRLEEEMRSNDYFLQADIYAHTLKRHLDIYKKGLFEKKFIGVFYVFLRGNAVYHVTPNFSKLASEGFLEEKV